ncbi:uncharacterized protein LOC125675332 [Ostrea edulis]|uniref:uncharacterized protein LOC125675332 n=1 Tax=Ostrea edulis TaxID=37623 RepID=UPI0024AF51E7|nr:uncharacterized protein LOC125675332 [Ostrea edulis]
MAMKLWVLLLFASSWEMTYSRSCHVERYTYYTKTYYYERCGSWRNWWRCKKSRNKEVKGQRCAAGWTTYAGNTCCYAICGGNITPRGACDQAQYVATKHGLKWIESNGECNYPGVCTKCNKYYYNNGWRCTACPSIPHCLEMHCDATADSTICANCEGVVMDIPYHRAYVRTDDRKQCLQACSWRTDSTRCYPGYCEGELADKCNCTRGFTGKHCEQMTEYADILDNLFKLRHNHYVLTNPSHSVDPGPHPVVWSNYKNWNLAETEWNAKYVIKERLPTNESHYIKQFIYGIIEASTTLNYTYTVWDVLKTSVNITDTTNSSIESNSTVDPVFNVTYVPRTNQKIDLHECSQASSATPATSSLGCNKVFILESESKPFNFSTGDTLTFTIQAKIGGHLVMENREREVNETHYLIGTTKTLQYVFRWDFVDPYHCVEYAETNSDCKDPLSVPDLTEDPSITIIWNDWRDDLAGLQEYHYEIQTLSSRGNILQEDGPLKENGTGIIYLNESSKSLKLPGTAGLFSIHLTAYDKAGNYKTTRRLVLYDSNSHVSHNPLRVTRVQTGSEKTNYTWIVDNTAIVDVQWPKRFRNSLHDHNKWLDEVSINPHISEKYDDYSGWRPITKVNNIAGCVDFKVEFFVYDGSGVRDSRELTSVSDISKESESLTLDWSDGDKAVITVVAVDIFNKTLNDTLTVFRDATPPIIENLWLTRGDRLNISVHRLEDFTEMTVEWLAYDYHSGIDSIYWKLYDNFTGQNIIHGHEDLLSQGSSQDMAECVQNYSNYSRGPNCYQTSHWGAYHRHFQVKPEVKRDGGLVHGKDSGVHDSDYFLEVKATNKALLSTVLTKKITIDLSPPHTGTVQDGLKGTDEVDFQQSKTLNAHWDGFFDKESGVMFYMYGFSTEPIPASALQLDSNNSIVKETYAIHATHMVATEGTYYVCVVAYNRALEPSKPVCSDGVTVTTTVPTVSEVYISSAHVRESLVTDVERTMYWVVSRNRHRRLIAEPTADCVSKAVPLPDVDMFPVDYYKNGSYIQVNGSVFCVNTSTTSAISSPVLSKSSHIILSWSANETIIHDYEVGLATVFGSRAPDVMAFRSTNQHRHTHLMHTDLPEGEPFYFIIKTISKANVEGIQSIGPCFVDTTLPAFSPPIRIIHQSGYLVAFWSVGSFSDVDDPFPLSLQFAIGHTPRGTQVQKYRSLMTGVSCADTKPANCTAMSVSDMEWGIHGNHTYYITIKAENAAGLTTYGVSEPYIHNVQLPSTGIVMDIVNDVAFHFIDIEDIDYTSVTDRLSARWTGFSHAYLDITYKFRAGTSPGTADVIPEKDVGRNKSHTEHGLTLAFFKTYYVTVTAVSSAGSVEMTSDGLTVVQENASLSGIFVFDGEECVTEAWNTTINQIHHDWIIHRNCTRDSDFQSSTDTLSGYWTISNESLPFTPDMYYRIEMKSLYGDDWSVYQNYSYNYGSRHVHVTGLLLEPGRLYRFGVKPCAIQICYQPTHSNGILILANPPASGDIIVNHDNSSSEEKLIVVMDMLADPDIQIPKDKYGVINRYEWAITDQSEIGRLHTLWHELKDFQVIPHKYKMEFTITLDGKIDFSKCRRFTVRGYNKAGVYSAVSTEIRDCSAFDPQLIKPNIVIDAVGTPDVSRDGHGEVIILQTNARWSHPDMDYTPNMNYISAVWPTLRYNSYTVAVIRTQNIDVATYYLPATSLSLKDPCRHADAIKCDKTEHEFINVKFNDGELEHGQRYVVCIHTEHTEITYEKWTQVLPEINVCSDGIVVDLTPPSAGNVWIGKQGQRYQISATDLYVTWDSFIDVEEFNMISHSSGIQNYQLGLGTSVGGNDVVAFFDVGVVNHRALHGLTLHSGHKYYATIRATDFANRTTIQTSPPIIIDTSSPLKTDQRITISGRHIISNSELETCWKGVFSDPESGIDFYMWSVGSQPGHSDIMEYTREDFECGVNDKNERLDIKEGHAYYISVKAFNKAHLMSMATSWAYTVDLSPPVQGHVLDVLPTKSITVDIDFQTDTEALAVVWYGFLDPHSLIQEYFINIGTCPLCDDVIGRQSVGLVNELTIDFVHFGSGLTYYTTVTACNSAEFCTTAVSDGVIMDNSPPNMGVVTDGTSPNDMEYQSIRNWIGARWYGFTDPQSGISHYVWWAGTTPGGKEILPEETVHLFEEASAYNFSQELPVSKRIYVTVRAYNKAGLFVDAVSNGFLVDQTPPEIKSGPKFKRDFGLTENTQFYRSSVKVEWDVDDPQSHIERQYFSVKSHIGGDFDFFSTQVNGIARDFILSGMKLHDGVTYYVTLHSCNGAQICASSTSSGILVDSTPPSRGMFAVQTDHTVDADLSRHVSGFMTWWKYSVNLAWLGFADAHSDITHYFINVGSHYMGADLNAKPGVPKKINHSTRGEDRFDEGLVQTYRIITQKLVAFDYLYISIWAVNKVGLSSAIVHSKFRKLPQGILFLVRRCESEDCEGQCVCAPQDKVCHNNGSSCIDVTIGNTNNLLQVSDVMFGTSDIQFTPSNTALQGRWSIVHRQGSPPFMYQWSVGFTDHDAPTGLFDSEHDRVWHDAGQNNFIISTTIPGQYLEEEVSYSVFVKAWYNKNTYAVFKSNGVIIATKKPATLNILGSSITEKMIGSVMKDDDYIKDGISLMLNWRNKFSDGNTTIKSYHVYIGTVPGGHDVWDSGEDLPNTETTYLVHRLSLSPGVQYYTNVIAYGFSGIHHTESSDGFKIDNVKPRAGIVFDGIGVHDLEYQNASDIIGARWHAFLDTGSGIKNYFWCVGNTSTISSIYSNTECSVRNWENVGIHISVSRRLEKDFVVGSIYYSKVYAVDNVGFESDIAVSDGVTIDTSPPQPQYLYHTDKNLLLNPSFEMSNKSLSVENVEITNICTLSDNFIPDHWVLTAQSCASVLSALKNLARDGKAFLFVRGSVKQVINGLKTGELYRLNLFSSHLSGRVASIANKEGFVSIGKMKHVFLLYSKAYRNDEHGLSSSREIVSWHRHTFYFTATDVTTVLEIGSADVKTGLFVDHVAFEHVEKNKNDSIDSHVSAHVVYLHEWGSIHGSWSFFEDFSPIREYQWAIGYTKGGTQLQGFTSVGQNNFGMNANVTLVHNTFVHITVTSLNTAELLGISYSVPIIVDLTPPIISYVYDGRSSSGDEDAWTDSEVVLKFMVTDEESDVDYCEWAIGYQPQGIELQTFERLITKETFFSKDFEYSLLENRTVYSTIRCHNRAGLSTSKSSDGVKISIRSPSVDHAEVVVLPMSITEYQAGSHYQSVKNGVKLRWSGFDDYVGIEQYRIIFSGDGKKIEEKMSFPIGQDMKTANIMNLEMVAGLKNITFQAINKLLLSSSNVLYNVTVVKDKPGKEDGIPLRVTWHAGNKEFTVSWDKVFTSKYPLFYEVSAGTVEGGTNILQWQETTLSSITFDVPPTITNLSNLSVHVFVRAINVGGTYEDIKGFIRLSK